MSGIFFTFVNAFEDMWLTRKLPSPIIEEIGRRFAEQGVTTIDL